MLKPDLLGIDLASLRTLILVHRLNSFSGAADELGIKQYSVSYTIDRLRRALNDQLFVRQGKGIAPTTRCNQIIQTAQEILNSAEQMAAADEFDPLEATGTVVIACNEYARHTFLPGATRRIANEAPKLSLRLVGAIGDVTEQLLSGQADIAFSPVEFDRSGIYQAHIQDDQYVCSMDRRNPLAKVPLDVETFASARHMRVDIGPGFVPGYYAEVEKLGYKIDVALTTPSNLANLLMVVGTPFILSSASRILRPDHPDLVYRNAPIRSRLKVLMYWAASTHHSPLHQWVRKLISDAAAGMPPLMEV